MHIAQVYDEFVCYVYGICMTKMQAYLGYEDIIWYDYNILWYDYEYMMEYDERKNKIR